MIKENPKGADYYKDPKLLAGSLSGQFARSGEAAQNVADEIARDRQGADYYEDEEILAQFLSGRFQ